MDVKRCFVVCASLFGLSFLLSCGGAPDRTLQAITLTPATADSSAGGVQFTAVGHWNTSPTITTPLSARWGVCQDNQPVTTVTVTEAGLATCGKGSSGTYTVFAADQPTSGPSCNAITACGGGCQISGSAQLTCQ